MPHTAHLPRRAFLLGVAALIASLSCGREVTGPAGPRFAHGFAFAARFAGGQLANGVASELSPYTRVRVILERGDGSSALDRVVDFPSTQEEVRLSLTIELSPDAPASGEVMDLSLRYINAAGDTVFRGGPVPVTVVPTTRDEEPPAPVEIDVDYSGPGADAAAVFIAPPSLTVAMGEPFAFTATVLGAQEQVITTAPVAWSSLDPAIATISSASAGNGVALQQPGTARIVAQLLSGQADTALLTVSPPTGPDVLVFTTQPANTAAGDPIVAVLELRDFQGAVRTDFTGAVGIALGANPGDDGLEGTTVVNAVAGVATFDDLVLTTAIAGYTLVASTEGGSAPVTSNAFAITHAPASQLTFDQQPTNAFTNATIAPAVVVRVMDVHGNLATGFVGDMTMDFAVATNATLGGTTTRPVTGGFATFADLTVNQQGEFSLIASIDGVGTANSGVFIVNDPPAGAVEWTNPAGGNWSVGSNWSTGLAPTATDSVAIALDGTYTVTLDVNPTVRALTVGGGTGTRTLAVGIRTLTVAETFTVLANAGLTVSSGTIIGDGALTNEGTVTLSGSSIPVPVHNNGLLVARGTSSLTGGVTTGPLSVIRALGASVTGTGALTVFGGLVNVGIIELTSIDGGFSSSLTVTDDPLSNMGTGVIRTLAGVGGGRTLAAQLVNFGTVQVDAAATLTRASVAHVNSGTINVAAANLTVTQSGTAPSFSNTGTINIDAGRTLSVSGGALDLTGGQVNGGPGTLTTTNVALTFQVPEARTRLNLVTTTVAGIVTIAAGDSIVLTDGSPTIDLVNEGTLITQGTVTLNGSLTTDPASLLLVRGASTFGTAALTIPHPQVNTGTIELTSINGGFTSTLTVTGTLTNAPSGVITLAPGIGGGRTITTALDNQGVINGLATFTLAGTDVAHLNSGTIHLSTGNATVALTAAGSFANTGTITLDAGRTFAVNNGALDLTGGTLNGYAATLARTGGTTTFTVPQARTRLALVATTVTGTFTIPAADSLILVDGTPTFDLVNEGLLITQGTVTINGALATTGNDTIRVRGASTYGTAALTLPAPFTNTGTIELTSIQGGFTSTLTVNGTLTNAPEGEIIAEPGIGGGRTINAELINQGLVRTPAALTLTRAGATHQNPGTIHVSGGNLTVQQVAGGFFLNPGTITLDAGRVLTVNNGTLGLTGGELNGGLATLTTNGATLNFTVPEARTRLNLVSTTVPGTFTIPAADSIVLVDASPTFTLVNEGLLVVQGNTTLNGTLTSTPNDTLRIRGAGTYGTAALTYAGGALTNNGTIELTSIQGGFTATLTVPGGIVNAATGTIDLLPGIGGGRTIAAQVQNSGDINVLTGATFSSPDAAIVNDGTIDVTGGNLTITQTAGGAFLNGGVVTLAPSQVLSVTGGTTVLTGGQVNGYGATLATNNTALTFTVPEARTRLNLVNTAVQGTFTIPAGDSLILVDGSPTFDLVNQGLLVTQGAATLNGTLTTTGNDTLRIRGAPSYGTAALTFPGALTNTGTIELTSIGGGFTSSLTVAGGLTNAPSGVIDILDGIGGGRTIAAELDNQGSINQHTTWTLARADAQHQNNGSIHVLDGQFTLTQTGTAPSFTNLPAGVIEITPGQVMAVTGGALDLTQGLLDGGMGTLRTTNVTLSFTVPTAVARFDLGTTTVPHTVTVPAGDSLVLVDGDLNAPIVNNGTLIAMGAVSLGGAITTDNASVLMSRGAATYGTSNLTVTNGFTNTGTIQLTSINGGFTSTFGVTNGTLVNAPDGVITVSAGLGGGRTIAAQLDNQGTVNIGALTSVNRASSAHVNSGTITLGGNLSVTQSGTTPSFTNLGTIVANANVLSFIGGTVDLTQGALTGTNRLLVDNATYSFAVPSVTIPMTLTNTTVPHTVTVAQGENLALVGGTLNAPLATNGTVVLSGTVSLSGAVTTGTSSNLRVLGTTGIGTAAATIVNGFTNNGIIEIGAVGGGFTSGLSITTGTLVNSASGSFNVTAPNGGSRSFTGALIDNFGTINVGITWNGNTAIDQRNSMLITAGTTTLSGALRLIAESATVVQTGATLVKNGGCTNLGGTISGGGTGATCP